MPSSFKDLNKLLADISAQTDKLLQAAQKVSAVQAAADIGNANPDELSLMRFKQTELLAHELAYTLTAETKHQAVVDEDGVSRNYSVQQIKTKNSGLVAFILVGEDQNNPRIHVVFRGTHNLKSMQRDLELAGFGPGGRTFTQKRGVIIEAINKAIAHKQKNCNTAVDLTISGHSLGGADAQNCMTAVLDQIANSNVAHPNTFSQLGSVNLLLANSAGVTSNVALSCERSLQIMARKDSQVSVGQSVILVGGDGVQQGGYTSALAKDTTGRVQTKLLKVDLGQEGKIANVALVMQGKIAIIEGARGTYVAHTTKLFGDTKKVEVKYKLYDSAIPEEREKIENSLKNKVYRKTYKSILPLQIIKKFANSVVEIGSNLIPKHKKK